MCDLHKRRNGKGNPGVAMPQAPKPHRTKPVDSDRQYDMRRGTAAERGYDSWWVKASRQALLAMIADDANPYCRYCEREDATLIDHSIPPTSIAAVGSELYFNAFRDERYWVPCCSRCNSLKRDKMPNELPEWMAEKLKKLLKTRGIELPD